MFDVYCPHCGEPYDQDVFHEPKAFDAPEGSYMESAALFKINGCGMFQADPSICTRIPVEPADRMELIKASMSLSEYPDEWTMFL
jgi:hypothetical protein